MVQREEMTYIAKVKMYEKLTKAELIEMLINCNNILDIISGKTYQSDFQKNSTGAPFIDPPYKITCNSSIVKTVSAK